MSDSYSESRQRRQSYWLWLVALLVLTAGAYWFVGKDSSPQSQGGGSFFGGRGMSAMPVPVKVATATIGPINYTLKAIGTVTSFNTVTVRSRVDGELQEIAFKDGQKVEAGDLLAQIDPRTYQNALDQALGQQKQNAAQLANAQRDLQRYQLLYKQNSIAKQQLDAQAALVQQLLGSRKSDQAAVDSAKLQLEFTRITAPISGRLGLRKIDKGNMVNASNTDGLVTITQTQPISVLFTLPQTQLPDVLAQLRAGKNLVTELYDRSDQTKIATGQLVSVDNQIDVATGTVSFKARFDNEDEMLFPNQFVNVRLRVDTSQALAIPTIAVQHGSVGAFVYLLDEEDKVHVQPIAVGRTDAKLVAVESGLSEGQRVVTDGVDRLREGAKVEVITADAVADAAVADSGAAKRSSGSPH
ncbi:MdtA/MuxA family multidrug efflux RND transporter periplasmic adaptor subunit [Pollutimonas harenae]|uniref:MdtA/MuxA family multidrug efflux RND transporter periplasmic adaptor subunit n=1 Tax=Pollutimonas harenae TaxID=657015 RepID=A0A853H1Z6_9BURK|nr:MdtA/MuxA family multidrug efflux RND transporter periplasmic adaptor subunit [Pollutimonas harenae]NYT84184.1 MdtA/MuxA family multidrug efflux RND transporter periplasmic adaptor subunit [Pollutimonas harenae]TEA73400.1 MdtA/MuxA family multidrug efflux RND transporter periplasmic adaptor subunit [Pollutimonas harenae]